MITFDTKTVTEVKHQNRLAASCITNDDKEWRVVWAQQYYFLNTTARKEKRYGSLKEAIAEVSRYVR